MKALEHGAAFSTQTPLRVASSIILGMLEPNLRADSIMGGGYQAINTVFTAGRLRVGNV